MDHSLDAILQRRLANVERTSYVSINIAFWRHIGVRYGDQCSKVKNRIDTFCDVLAIVRVADVAAQYFYLLAAVHAFQPTPVVERVVLRQGFDLVPLADEQLGKVGPDETVRTSYKNIFHSVRSVAVAGGHGFILFYLDGLTGHIQITFRSRARKSDPRSSPRAGCKLRCGDVMSYGILNS